LTQWVPWIIFIGVAIFALALLLVARATIQVRRGAYFFMRENAIKRARRSMFMGTVALILSIVIALLISNQPVAIVAPNTPTRIVVFAVTKTSTAAPSPTPTFTPTPSPSPSPTIVKTITPTVPPGSVPGLLLTPLPSAVPVATSAKFTLTTLASVLDSKQNPVDRGVVFPQGTRAIHIFFRASGVNNGARWAVFCKKGNQIVDSFIALWAWGPLAQSSHAVCGIDGSLGTYSVVGYLDFNQQFEAVFNVVVPPPTAVPTLTPAPTTAP
jgi:hypothetical protein